MKKHFKQFIPVMVLVMTSFISLNAQTLVSKSQNNQITDINSKAQELGISVEQLQSILNTSSNNGGGDPQPDAMQERFFTGLNADDTFGMSLSSAGDVNGDGYDDIIIGAPNNDAGGVNAGRAYIFYGGNIINSLADIILTGTAANDLFGRGVSTAGDVNGDGYSDVIVGIPGQDGAGSNAGAAYIYFGGASMDNIADVIMTGEAAGDQLGFSVASAGDVTGDGYSDVIAGAFFNDAAGTDAGRAYIYFGGQSMNNIADVILTAEAAGDQFGFSVSTAGDVNGDGYSDAIVSGSRNDTGGTDRGRAYIYFGGQSMDNIADVILTGDDPGDTFGNSVSTAGDVNGDGYSDVIVGAANEDTGGANSGSAYVFYGGPTMDITADVMFVGDAASDQFGLSVSECGDINGDGYSDVIVGAYFNDVGGSNAGRAYVYFGEISMDNINDGILTGEAASDQFGWAVSSAGDVNGDGYCDFIVGANFNDAGGTNAGRAYLYTNSLTGTDIPDEFFIGTEVFDEFGYSVSTAGDVNGDGYSDLIVGAPFNDSGGNNVGRVYIYLGGAILDNVADIILTAESLGDNFGNSVSFAGDVNRDGYSDVIVGANSNSTGGTYAGRAYVYFGGTIMDGVADVIFTGEASGDFFGASVSNAGDVNGDGYSDVIIGANFNDAGVNNAGRAYIYFGGASMDNTSDIIFTGETTSNFFGWSVSEAGDVNGDGYSDVIVGAVGYGSNTGRAYIYFGGSSMNNVADVILTGEAAGDRFGCSVSTAGDVNNDGYSDVIVGANLNDVGGFEAGRVYTYFGSTSMDNAVDVILTGESIYNYFGESVSSVGDINKDGYSDIIIGANGNDVAGNNAGRAYIYFGGGSMNDMVDVALTGEASDGSFGISVSTAGDVNNDGYSDIIVGANFDGIAVGRAFLYLSSAPTIQPVMQAITDVTNDQGGYVRVRWNRSGYDIPGQGRIAEYILQRSDPPGQSGFVWDYVATIPAIREFEYSYVSPTPSDSFSNSSGTFYFRVIARGTNPDELWYSNIMYGHSVDNLSPSVPLNFYATNLNDDVKLGWKANSESDLLNYVIYRTDVAGANPDTLEIYATVFDTTFVDTNPISGTAFYFLKAQDVHNNLSPYDSATISTQTTFALSVNVSNGWNMVSVPGLHPVDQNVNTWWQYRDQSANVFRYAGGYQSVTSTTPGTGYWMKHSGARTYNTGDEWPAGGIQIVSHNPLFASAGWNLIGGYELSVTAANVTTNPPGLQSGPIYKYSGGYQVATTLDPGYGYWIKLTDAGQIIIPETLSKENELNDWFPDDWGRIIISDASERSFTLYTITDQVDLNKYELPPLPPAGSFDVRFSSGRIAENINDGFQSIDMTSVEYPVTVTVENISINLQDETGQIISELIKSGEKITIDNPAITKLRVGGQHKPDVFVLEQNYPNPFNPSTKIKFTLPVSSLNLFSKGEGTLVTLKVYDILGNEVATLVNEEKPAGSYEVEFSASSISSGIYFYILRASSFVQTKKMLLIK